MGRPVSSRHARTRARTEYADAEKVVPHRVDVQAPEAQDIPIAGDRLLIKDHRVHAKRQIVLTSSDPAIDGTGGTSFDPTISGAILTVYRSDGHGDVACYRLAPSKWRARPTRSGITFQYSDRGFADAPCDAITIKSAKLLKVRSHVPREVPG